MQQLVECVPNFSEGRRPEVIEAIAEAVRKTSGVMLLEDRAKIMRECPTSGRLENGAIPCNDGGYAAVQRVRTTLAPLTTVALSVGAAGVAAGVILALVDAHSGGGRPRTGSTVPLMEIAPRGASLGVMTQW